MHRFVIDPNAREPLEVGHRVDLPDELSHQIRNVLRLNTGDQFVLFTGDGREWTAELATTSNRKVAAAQLTRVSEPDVEMVTRIVMAMALTRTQRYELALAKCTELGASEFIPFVSQRVQTSESRIGENRMARWKRVVREAAELSGRVRIPAIAETARFSEALTDLERRDAEVVFLWERATGPTLAELIQRLNDEPKPARTVALILGPVGGFSENEAELALEKGAHIASLGPRILRTETAAIASMSLAAQLLR